MLFSGWTAQEEAMLSGLKNLLWGVSLGDPTERKRRYFFVIDCSKRDGPPRLLRGGGALVEDTRRKKKTRQAIPSETRYQLYGNCWLE